ncbi:MAG: hypothetical protein Q8Q09_09275 [Deltaproteobacteria bacterium]|nr:hypothetical protein [Deltaproteobacteria bacterium]
MTPPIDPEMLAKLRARIATVAIASAVAGTLACKQTPAAREPAPNEPMPHTVNEPVRALPVPTAQEQAQLPAGRVVVQDLNEPSQLPDTAPVDAAAAQAVNEPGAPPTAPPTINNPPSPPRRIAPPGNG